MPEERFGQYRELEPLGAGGMGEVYLATDTTLQRRVALKFLSDELQADDEARERILGEARAASALNHPHVCTIYEVGQEGGRWYIAMEYVEGRPLNEIIARGAMPAERIESYGVQVADAIAHAHDRGVIHRDMKSSNIMVTPEGRAKVLDFGLALHQGLETEAATRSRVTSAESGSVSGTLPYMAPEMLRGQPADERIDVWALGVILYEMASGQLPFQGETAFELTSSILKDSVRLSGEIPAGVRAIIQRCLAKSPGERYQSAAEVRAALEAVKSATSETVRVAEVTPDAPRPTWVNRAWIGAVVVVVIGAFLWAYSGGGRGGGEGGLSSSVSEGLAIGASGRPAIAVLEFEDHTGSEEDAWLVEGVPSMLQTGLAQTAGLDIVSSRRIEEILSQLGQEGSEDLDLATLGEIARRSGVGALVFGAVYAAGDGYRIDVQVEDVGTGRMIAAHTATGPDVFALADDLAVSVRSGLALQPVEKEAGIATITTESLEAWRYYSEGLEAYENLRYADARDALLRAVEIDPEFALAHGLLVMLQPYLVDPTGFVEHERFLRENVDRLPERDRLYFAAYFQAEDGDAQGAAETYLQLIDRYPDFEGAYIRLSLLYDGVLLQPSRKLDLLRRGVEANPASGNLRNQFGYTLFQTGQFAAGMRQIEAYAELNPTEPNPLDSLAEMHLMTGQPERAAEIYAEASELDPTWTGSLVGRASAFAMLGRYTDALAELDAYGDISQAHGFIFNAKNTCDALLFATMGRPDEADAAWREDLAIGEAIEYTQGYANVAKAGGTLVSFLAGDYATVVGLGEEIIGVMTDVESDLLERQVAIGTHAAVGIALARLGDLPRAREHLESLQEIYARDMEDERWYTDSLRGEIELAEGRFEEALSAFRAAEPEIKMQFGAAFILRAWMWNNSPWRDGAARALRAQGDVAGAITEYRRLVTPSMTSKFTSFLEPRYVLELARLLDEAGDAETAAAEYARFAELWQDADPELQSLVEEARQRAAALGG
jgi:tetratricopeptide (TPR) repeat protein/tRNA A-37 threonylcarbamoyl transferase component Bud32